MLHVTYQLNFLNKQYSKIDSSTSSTGTSRSKKCQEICVPIKSGIFFDLFPFYIIFNRNMEIVSLGESLKQAVKSAVGELIKDVFNMARPNIPFTWDDVCIFILNNFQMILKSILDNESFK